MVLFRGTFDHTLDAKKRLTVPARYRAALADGVVLGMLVDNKPCVGVWQPQEYAGYSRRADCLGGIHQLAELRAAPDGIEIAIGIQHVEAESFL